MAGFRKSVHAGALNTSGLTPDGAEFQAQVSVLAQWARHLAAKTRRLELLWHLGLLTLEEWDELFAEVARWRDAVIRLAAMRRAER